MPEKNEGSQLPVRYQDQRPLVPDAQERALAALDRFEPPGPTLRDYLAILIRRKWTVIIGLGVIFGITCFQTITSPRIYEATAILLVTKSGGESSSSSAAQAPPAVSAMAAPDLQTHANLVRSAAAAEAAAAWLRQHGGPELPAAAIRGAVRAGVVRDTQLLSLSARARTPEQAQRIANAVAMAYTEMNRQRARGSSESASRYLSEQLAIAKQNLTTSENALRAFKETSGTVAEDAAASELLNRAASLRGDLDKTRADLSQIEMRLRTVRNQLAAQNRSIAAMHVRDNAVVQQLRARLVDLEGQRRVAEAQYTSAFRGPLDQIEEQIRIVKEQLDTEIRNIVRGGSADLATQQSLVSQLIQGEAEVAALRARVRSTQAEIRKAEAELQKIPARQVTLARLQRQVDVAQSIYSDLLRQSQEVEVGRVMALGNTDVVELAERPLVPVKPNVPLNLAFGLLLGIAVGVGVALLQEQLDDTIRDEDDIGRYAAAPVLGVVPAFQTNGQAAALPVRAPKGRAVDAYRGLRVNLGFVTPGTGGRAVLVTSPGPQEGKTTTAVNLAIAAAQSGRRVILVDSDMRRPALHRLFSLNGLKGLSDVLVGQAGLGDALQGVEEGNLRLISSGTRPPNPTDLLDSSAMRALIEDLRKQADLVIFDSPPLLSAADALVLASLSDAVVMVCIPGASHRRALQRSRLLLNQIGRDISGVVLNKVERRPGYGYYYGYYHYYYYADQQPEEDTAGQTGQS